jgi:pyruvate kinase
VNANKRKTKIIATLGPATRSPEMIQHLIEGGVDVVRLNFSHGTAQDHLETAKQVRDIAKKGGHTVAILCDLQGTKVRIGKFQNGKIELKTGDIFILDTDCEMGDQYGVGLDYPNFPNEVSTGAMLSFDDGRIIMEVDRISGQQVYCLVIVGGVLGDYKGINLQGGGLSADALTEKDKEDIRTCVALGADFIAISFPKSAADIELGRRLVQEAGGQAHIVAKIERAEAIAALEEIIIVSDVVMVARGDLGVEVGDAAVPSLQKRIIRMAREKNKVVITATQMMESMVGSPIPTRAEVSDVANAVLDGTDAIMLSAETATGEYPLEAVAAVVRVCVEAEKESYSAPLRQRAEDSFDNVEETIARAAVYTGQHFDIKAIVALTQSGKTARLLSRASTRVPIYAISPLEATRNKLKLYRGVYPCPQNIQTADSDEMLVYSEEEVVRQGGANKGDMILLTIGEPIGKAGSTNSMKIVKVGEHTT